MENPPYATLPEPEKQNQIRKTVIGIMNCLKTGTPLDFNNFKAMHKDTPVHDIIHNKSKSDEPSLFEEYLTQVDKILGNLELKLLPIYDTKNSVRIDKTKIPSEIPTKVLAGFSVKNHIVDRKAMKGLVLKEMQNLAKNDKRESAEYEECLELLDSEIENMKKCNLLQINNNNTDNIDMLRFLKCQILAFIFTRSYQLGYAHGEFWNEASPLQSFVTLRDIYNFLKTTFDLNVPTELEKDGGHDIRFHGGENDKGYLKRFVTRYLTNHQYISFYKSDHIRDGHIYDGDSEDGKVMVSWGVKAIGEFDVEDILMSVSGFVCEDAYPAWMQDEDFMAALRSFQDACETVKSGNSGRDGESIEGVFKKWSIEKMRNRK